MKTITKLVFGLLLFNCSCGFLSADSKKKILPGTYIRIAQNEFGHEYDTIIITLINQSTKEYKITHKWKFERIVDGQQLEPEYRVQIKSGVFDDESGLLGEAGTLDQFSFKPDQKLMTNGPNQYRKID